MGAPAYGAVLLFALALAAPTASSTTSSASSSSAPCKRTSTAAAPSPRSRSCCPPARPSWTLGRTASRRPPWPCSPSGMPWPPAPPSPRRSRPARTMASSSVCSWCPSSRRAGPPFLTSFPRLSDLESARIELSDGGGGRARCRLEVAAEIAAAKLEVLAHLSACPRTHCCATARHRLASRWRGHGGPMQSRGRPGRRRWSPGTGRPGRRRPGRCLGGAGRPERRRAVAKTSGILAP